MYIIILGLIKFIVLSGSQTVPITRLNTPGPDPPGPHVLTHYEHVHMLSGVREDEVQLGRCMIMFYEAC